MAFLRGRRGRREKTKAPRENERSINNELSRPRWIRRGVGGGAYPGIAYRVQIKEKEFNRDFNLARIFGER